MLFAENAFFRREESRDAFPPMFRRVPKKFDFPGHENVNGSDRVLHIPSALQSESRRDPTPLARRQAVASTVDPKSTRVNTSAARPAPQRGGCEGSVIGRTWMYKRKNKTCCTRQRTIQSSTRSVSSCIPIKCIRKCIQKMLPEAKNLQKIAKTLDKI